VTIGPLVVARHEYERMFGALSQTEATKCAIALAVLRLPTADIVPHRLYAAEASPLTAAKGTSVIPVLNQYKCIGCSPGKHPDIGTMAPGSDDDSRDSVRGRCLCISV
jgi:hypothetical protein